MLIKKYFLKNRHFISCKISIYKYK